MNIALTTQETLGLMKDSLAKNVTVSTGLTAYDLQAPAKNLYPTITPLRNSLPRVARLNPGDAAHWRSIFSTTGSGFDAMGWVPEGQRSASMSYSAVSVTLPYVTLGEEDTVTFEAEAAAQGFEDVNATATLRILHPDIWNQQKSQIDQAAKALSDIYGENVFPLMKVTWGTHPNNLGHNDYPGCFRCHDGSHNTKEGKSIGNDCSTCHNLLAVDEANPKQLADLGLQ